MIRTNARQNFFSVSKQNIKPKCDNPRDAERYIGKEICGLINGLQSAWETTRGTNMDSAAAPVRQQPARADDQRHRR
ncbi:hypothetical protein [Paraburkholderia caffeinilytica]|uniref:hypothetical protein n=1 Tax=Paraburkholderia caffeinilytica TaxID=1761016 RepID=UPI003DA0C034